MADSGVRSRALAALRDGRVTITLARSATPSGPPEAVCAFVDSSRGNGLRYVVDLMAGAWHCTCGITVVECVHVAAVQLVVGHESAAAKTVRGAA